MIKMKTYNIIFVLSLIYFFATYTENIILGGQLLMIIPLGIMALISWMKEGNKIKVHSAGFLIYIVCIIIFCVFSKLWSQNPDLSTPKINSLIFIFFAMCIFANCQSKFLDIEGMLKIFMYGGHFVIVYCFLKYGFNNIIYMLEGGQRISSDLINANTLGMCAAYSIVLNIYFILYDRLSFRDVLMLPSMLILVVSQSRKALLIAILGLVGVYILKNLGKKITVNTIFKFLGGLLVLILLIYAMSKMPLFASYMERMEQFFLEFFVGGESVTVQSLRAKYNELGMELFKTHPFLGIGIANANIYTDMYYGHNHYLHNNYVELLACGGIIGFLIYYSMYAYFIFSFAKYRKYRDKEYDICLILLVLVLIMDYGWVSYYSRSTYMYMLLFYLEIRKLKMKDYQKKSIR